MIQITNKNLINYLQTILNKKYDNIDYNDLDNIQNIYFEGEMKEDEAYKINISDITKFKNLKQVCITNALITLENLNLIRNSGASKVILKGCAIDADSSLIVLDNITSLELIGCFIEDYSFLTDLVNLKSLVIFKNQSSKEVNAEYIQPSIESLTLQDCRVNNFNSISKLINLRKLNIFKSLIKGDIVPTLNKLSLLEEIYIYGIYDLSGLNNNIKVKTNLNDLLVDDEENTKHI